MKNLLIEELYEKYSFIEKDKKKFRSIALKGIKASDKDAKDKATNNIIGYIVNKIKNKKLNVMLDKAVKRYGIENAFSLYDMIIKEIEDEIEIDASDIMKIACKSDYQKYFDEFIKNKKETKNDLLKEVIDIIKRETDLEDIFPFSPNVEEHVREYFKMLKKPEFDVLNRTQELELIKRYRKTQDEEVKEEFINHNLRLVANIAGKEKRIADSKLPLMDLIQEGHIGLLKAFDEFNENLGFKFSTYAWYKVRAAVRAYIRDNESTIRIPAGQAELLKKRNHFIYEYCDKYNKEPTEEEIMQFLGLDTNRYKKLKKLDKIRNAYSIDASLDRDVTSEDSDSVSLLEFRADENATSVEDEVIEKYSAEQILDNAKLSKKEKKVAKEMFGFNKYNEEKSQQQIANEIGVVRERVRQIENQVIGKLQKYAEETGLYSDVKKSAILNKEDLIKRIEEKGMNLKVIHYRVKTNGTRYECLDCGTKFQYKPEELLKLGHCPYCEEKKLIKK